MPSLLFFYFTVFMFGIMLSFTGLLVIMALLGPDGRDLGRKVFSIGLTSVWRPALSVNDVGELILKKRSYNDERNIEQISVGGIDRDLQDPQNRIHYCYGTPLALVDEIFGLVFDQRDADIGRVAKRLFEHDDMYYEEERDRRLIERVRAFFEIPQGHRGVRLEAARSLVGGGGVANLADRLIEHYRTSQEPRETTTPLRQMLIPVGTFTLIVLLGWFISSQGGGGGGGLPVRNINIGLVWLLIGLSGVGLRRRLIKIDRKLRKTLSKLSLPERSSGGGSSGDDDGDSGGGRGLPSIRLLFVVFLVSMLTLGLAYLPTMFFPFGVVWKLWASLLIGLLLLPATAYFLGRSLGALGVALGKLYIIIGLLPFDRPVLFLDENEEQKIIEATERDDIDIHDLTWYRFAKSWLGFDYENSNDVWPGENTAMDSSEIEAVMVADGGANNDSIPPGYAPTKQISYAGHDGIVPKNIEEDTVYVQTHHTLSWYREVGRARDLLFNAYSYAKEKYGHGTKPISETKIMIITAFMALLAGLFDWLWFFS